jgi:hypothetical protein
LIAGQTTDGLYFMLTIPDTAGSDDEKMRRQRQVGTDSEDRIKIDTTCIDMVVIPLSV